MGFTDPDHNIDEHNMLFDVPYPGMHRPKRVGSGLGHSPACHEGEADTNPTSVPSPEGLVFGVVKHYPPDWWDREHDEPSGRRLLGVLLAVVRTTKRRLAPHSLLRLVNL